MEPVTKISMGNGAGASVQVQRREMEGVNGANDAVARGAGDGLSEGPGKAQALAANIMKGVLQRSRSRLAEVHAGNGADHHADVSGSLTV